MKKTLLTIAALAFGLSSSVVSPADYGAVTVSRVAGVYDGDTIYVDVDYWPPIIGDRVKIRIADIDTPELGKAKCKEEKAKAIAARDYVAALLKDAELVELRHMERGDYFRIKADVFFDGRNLGEELVAAGLARPYGNGRRSWCGDEGE